MAAFGIFSFQSASKEERLISASKKGDLKTVQKLLLDNVNIYIKDENGKTALQNAVEMGHNQISNLLKIEEGKLIIAIKDGKYSEVKRHIENGADVNRIDEKWGLPLRVAYFHGKWQIVKLLLEHDVDVTINNCGIETLSTAARMGEEGVIELLLAKGVDVNAKDCDALHKAVITERLGIIKILLSAGANINAENKQGYTPLLYACKQNQWEIATFLAQNGARGDFVNEYGETPITLAMEYNQHELVQLLKTSGEVDAEFKYSTSGDQALLWAARDGRMDMVKDLLREPNININVNHPLYGSALSCAAKNLHWDIVVYLIENGVNINVVPKGTKSNPIVFLAIEYGKVEVIKMLIARNINLDIEHWVHNEDEEGAWSNKFTPMDWAKARGQDEVYELLQIYSNHLGK